MEILVTFPFVPFQSSWRCVPVSHDGMWIKIHLDCHWTVCDVCVCCVSWESITIHESKGDESIKRIDTKRKKLVRIYLWSRTNSTRVKMLTRFLPFFCIRFNSLQAALTHISKHLSGEHTHTPIRDWMSMHFSYHFPSPFLFLFFPFDPVPPDGFCMRCALYSFIQVQWLRLAQYCYVSLDDDDVRTKYLPFFLVHIGVSARHQLAYNDRRLALA